MPPHPFSVAVVRALDALADEGSVRWQGAPPDADEAEDARLARVGARYASSLPLRVSGRTGLPAPQLAALLAGRLTGASGVGSAIVAGPGYIEIEPDPAALVRAALAVTSHVTERATGLLDPLPDGDVPDALRAAVREVGPDAVRFALARRTTEGGTLDLDVLGRADERNPGHAVQLAAARLAGVLRQAADLGVHPATSADVDPRLLAGPPDDALVAAVAEADAIAARAVRLGRADLLARHLETTAEAAHRFLATSRVLPRGDEGPDDGHRARLRLASAARTVIADGLDLLGVPAPERM